jgi:hypothetical protein
MEGTFGFFCASRLCALRNRDPKSLMSDFARFFRPDNACGSPVQEYRNQIAGREIEDIIQLAGRRPGTVERLAMSDVLTW